MSTALEPIEKLTPSIINSPDELKKFGIDEREIAEIVSIAGKLEIADIHDKEGIKRVEDAWRNVRNLRLGLGKTAEELKEPALKWQRVVLARHKALADPLDVLEKNLKAKLKAVEDEKKRLAEEAERQRELMRNQRISKLLAAGFSFNGLLYSIGELVVSVDALQDYTDDDFAMVLNRGAKLNEQLEADKRAEQERQAKIKADEEAEAARIKAQEQAEAERIKAENEAKAKELAEREAAITAKENEQKAAEAKRLADRYIALDELGLVKIDNGFYEYPGSDIDVSGDEIQSKTDHEWIELLAFFRNEITLFKATIAAKAEEAAEAEKKRIEAMKPDLQKLSDFATELKQMTGPEITDPILLKHLQEIMYCVHDAGNILQLRINSGKILTYED